MRFFALKQFLNDATVSFCNQIFFDQKYYTQYVLHVTMSILFMLVCQSMFKIIKKPNGWTIRLKGNTIAYCSKTFCLLYCNKGPFCLGSIHQNGRYINVKLGPSHLFFPPSLFSSFLSHDADFLTFSWLLCIWTSRFPPPSRFDGVSKHINPLQK